MGKISFLLLKLCLGQNDVSLRNLRVKHARASYHSSYQEEEHVTVKSFSRALEGIFYVSFYAIICFQHLLVFAIVGLE